MDQRISSSSSMDLSPESDGERIMEGWLYVIRSSKFGFQYSRKQYYVLHDRRLRSFQSISHSLDKDPIKSAVIDSSIRVMDHGRKSIRGKVFFIFILCRLSNRGDHVKLGARSPEEAARWIESFHKVCLKVNQNPGDILDHFKYEQQYWRSNNSGRVHDTNSVDNTLSLASITDPKTFEIHETSYWKIFGCHNGLRLFKEARNQEGHDKIHGHPAIAAVSVINGTPEVVFQMLMSLGTSRSEWDFCFHKGSVIETINGHTDIVHKTLNDDWLPWGMKRRDLLLQRNWRREDDGTYIIFYHSVLHKKCPHQKGYVRACLKSGGYVIAPVNPCEQSIVRHMVTIDWKSWRSYLQKSSTRSLSIRMLGRLAALRELFKTNLAKSMSYGLSSQEIKRVGSMRIRAQSQENREFKDTEGELVKAPSDYPSLEEMDDESDEFFDFPETLVDDQSETGWTADFDPEIHSQDIRNANTYTPPANILMKKLHEYTVQREKHADLEEIVWENSVSCNYRITLPQDQTGNLLNSWSAPDPSLFEVRGETFLEDCQKITAKSTLMQTVAVDWLRSDRREDNLAARPGSIVQKFASDGHPAFFFVVNFQIPGSTTYNIASYYMTSTPIKDVPLLEKFIEGDDAFRNSRFKLIPHVTKGPWILRQSVRRASLLGQELNINYVRGKNYIELDIDVGSSTLARGVAGTALSCFNHLIAETAFVLQANMRDELPERLYGACRLNHLDVSRAFWANS